MILNICIFNQAETLVIGPYHSPFKTEAERVFGYAKMWP